MKNVIEYAKRLGAGIIVLFLVLIMGLTFSSQPMDEILALLGGQTRYGSFDGDEISSRDYRFALATCEDRFSQFGRLPAVFLNGCLETTLQELYVLPRISERLGLNVPDEQIEKELVDIARQAHQNQEVLIESDRRSVQDFYQELVRQGSIELRSRESSARRLGSAIMSMEPAPDMLDAAARARATTVNLRIVRYSQTSLLAGFDDQVEVSDEDLDAEYLNWKKEDPSIKPLEEIQGQVMDRVRTKKKQAMLAEAKDSLGQLKPEEGLQAVANITGVQPIPARDVPLEGLSRIPAGGQPVNLATGSFFQDLTEFTPGQRFYGPYQDGEATVYVEIQSLRPGQVSAGDQEALEQEVRSRMQQEVYRYLIRTEAQRGNFEFRQLADENQEQLDLQQSQ